MNPQPFLRSFLLVSSSGLLLLSLALASFGQNAAPTLSYDFESAGREDGWQKRAPGAYEYQAPGSKSGRYCLMVTPGTGRAGAGVRVLSRSIDVAAFRGMVVSVSVLIRSSILAEKTSGSLGIRVGRAGHAGGLRADRFDDLCQSPDWEQREIIFGVAKDATSFEVLLYQRGAEPVWFDDLVIKSLGPVTKSDFGPWISHIPKHKWDNSPVQYMRMVSDKLSRFWGREVAVEAAVILPADYDGSEQIPVCYNVHGFGGSHWGAWNRGKTLQDKMKAGYPRMAYVFLNASCAMGHHVFADSVNTGPWGAALVEEFIPEVEKLFGGVRPDHKRFLTGHSSGGWSTLWLQVNYPKTFGSTWSTAPDPVDFRDFTNIDIYRDENAYVDENGEARPLVRRGGRVLATLEQFTRREHKTAPYGGQMASFDAVFSPKGDDGRPQPIFDRETGAIDRDVAAYWANFDIGLILRENYSILEPALKGKLHIWIGTEDTFYLDGACKLLKDDLAAFNSDADILMVKGRDHSSLFAPHDEHWPKGMMERVHREMLATAAKGETAAADPELEGLFAEIDDLVAGADQAKALTEADQGGT